MIIGHIIPGLGVQGRQPTGEAEGLGDGDNDGDGVADGLGEGVA